MANPDAGNTDSQLGNKPPTFKRKAGGKPPKLTLKTANWPGLPGKSGPDRSAGVKKLKIHPASQGL